MFVVAFSRLIWTVSTAVVGWVYVPPVTVKVLPGPRDIAPAFVKFPVLVKSRPLWSEKLPVAAFVEKFAKPFTLDSLMMGFVAVPLRIMFAAFVTILAPVN